MDNESRNWDVEFRASQDTLKDKEMMRSCYREKEKAWSEKNGTRINVLNRQYIYSLMYQAF